MNKAILYVFFLVGGAFSLPAQSLEREVVVVGGALPRVLTAPDPAQMINPFAPTRYGSGWDLVGYAERDPFQPNNLSKPQPNGIRLLTIRPIW